MGKSWLSLRNEGEIKYWDKNHIHAFKEVPAKAIACTYLWALWLHCTSGLATLSTENRQAVPQSQSLCRSLAQPSSSLNTLCATGSISHQFSRWGEAFAVSAGDLSIGILARLHLQQPSPSVTRAAAAATLGCNTSPKASDPKTGPEQLVADERQLIPQLSKQACAMLR